MIHSATFQSTRKPSKSWTKRLLALWIVFRPDPFWFLFSFCVLLFVLWSSFQSGQPETPPRLQFLGSPRDEWNYRRNGNDKDDSRSGWNADMTLFNWTSSPLEPPSFLGLLLPGRRSVWNPKKRKRRRTEWNPFRLHWRLEIRVTNKFNRLQSMKLKKGNGRRRRRRRVFSFRFSSRQ